MSNQDYNAVITVNKTAKEALNSINKVKDWWIANTEGSAQNLNDVFTIHFSGDSFVTFKVVEFEAGKKAVWLVTDCYLPWFKDKAEWTNTKTNWELTEQNGTTQISFTHVGLTPEVECYDMCVKGWDFYVKTSLLKLINEGKGQPDVPKAERDELVK